MQMKHELTGKLLLTPTPTVLTSRSVHTEKDVSRRFLPIQPYVLVGELRLFNHLGQVSARDGRCFSFLLADSQVCSTSPVGSV